jgi:ribosomal protein S6--L-glutamate ligase
MLTLAVATRAETYERLSSALADRGIAVEHVPTRERTMALDGDPFGVDADVGFVYPPRLAEGGVADALLDVPWVNDREAVLRSRHKGETLARLSQAGLPIPDTVAVSNPADDDALREAFERVGPPVVVKPNSATRGIGVARADDLDSFLGVVDYLDLIHDYPATGDRSFLVQEYVPDARDYRAMVVDGRYVGAVERRLPESDREAGRWKHNVHRGAAAEGVSLPDDHRRLAERAAEALSIPYLGVDLLVSGERAVVNETNARPTVDDAAKYEPGFHDDLAALIRDRAEG